MSSFTSPLRTEDTDRFRDDTGRPVYILLEPFTYEVGALGSGDVVRVPAKFETDFGSIPRAFWWLEPPRGRAGKAAVVHDWLYASKLRNRTEADKIFLEALGVLGVPYVTRQAMYRAVRAGGAGGYGRPEEYALAMQLLANA